MNSIWQDIRFGMRMLAKHRFTSLACIAALALGIGANTVVFSLAEAFLLHPVPFESADRVVALVDSRPGQGIDVNSVAPATFFDWKKEARSFEQLAAYAWQEINLTGDREPQKVQAFAVTVNLFAAIGVRPEKGRAFYPKEQEPGKDQEIILSYGLWTQRYGSDPRIIGKSIKVDGKPFEVVGVMAKGFDFPLPAEAWIPLSVSPKDQQDRANRWFWVLGRLKPGVSFATAAAEMQAIAERQAEAYPDTNKGWQLRPLLLREFVTSTLTRQYTLLLLAAVGFVLLIACADVANVQFARVTARTNEFAVRAALGGSRWRVVRLLVTESVLLSLAGGVVSLLLAQWGLQVTLAHMPSDVAKFIAGWKTIRLDAGAFLFTFTIAVFGGILSGIAPAFLGSRANLSETLKEGGRTASLGRARHRLRSVLVVAEVSLALVLLVGAGLLVKGFQGLLNINENYSPQTLLTMNVVLPELHYSKPEVRLAFHEQVLQRLAGVPGVQSATLVSRVPYVDGGYVGTDTFSIEGRAHSERGELTDAIIQTATAGYLSQFHIDVLDGRFLMDADRAGAPRVAVISQSLARRYFAGENPIGKHIRVGAASSDDPWLTIVGIVKDIHYSWIVKEDVPTIYRSLQQSPPYYTTIVLRTAAKPLQYVYAVRREIAAVDPELPLYNIKTQDTVITESIVGIAYVAVMMAALGFIALTLACVGVFGVMSYAVSERAHEIGVRISLGAGSRDIMKMVLGSGLLLTALGLAIGLPIAFLLARALSSLLFGVDASDAGAFVGLPLLLAAVAALACYLPARRAARVDPLRALRYE